MTYQTELNEASKTVQKQISETEKRIGETTRQFQREFAKTLEEMNRTVMSRASAEMQLGLKLSQKLSAARSPSDAVSAYQEWLTEQMSERSEAARGYMASCQKFITESARLFSNNRGMRTTSRRVSGNSVALGRRRAHPYWVEGQEPRRTRRRARGRG